MSKAAARPPSKLNQILAAVCVNCPMCRRARQRQRGFAFGMVKKVEAKLCPFCRAYQRVYGQNPSAPAK